MKDECCKHKQEAMIVHWMKADSSAMFLLQLLSKHKVFFREKGKQVA